MNDATERRFGCCCVAVKFPDCGADVEKARRLLEQHVLLLTLAGDPLLYMKLGEIPAPFHLNGEPPHIHEPLFTREVVMARDGSCSDVAVVAPKGTRVYLLGEWNGASHGFVRWMEAT